jgi:DNA polymerase-1
MLVTPDTYESVLTDLKQYTTWVVDVETNGLEWHGKNQICGIGVAVETGDTYYFPFRHYPSLEAVNLHPPQLFQLMEVMNNCSTLIGYNIKFDLHFLENEGLVVGGKELIDVIVLVRLTEPADVREFSLTATIKRSYGEEAAEYDITTKKILRKNKWNKDFSQAPPTILGPYCEKDVEYTWKLYQDRIKELERTKQTRIFDLEKDLTHVLYTMEKRGLPVDSNYAKQAAGKILQRQEQIKERIFQAVGHEFLLTSPAQVGEALTSLGVESSVKTSKGNNSWGEEALAQINHPVAGYIRQYRTLDKLRATYLEPYFDINTVHSSFCNWGTLTGRLSSRDPNLQNLPRTHFRLSDDPLLPEEREVVRGRISAAVAAKGGVFNADLSDEVIDTWGFIGDESYNESNESEISIRRLFIPRPGYTLVGFDYSQMEVRVFLDYFRNPEIVALLKKEDVDFHGEAATLAFNVEKDDPEYKYYRQMAKAITFGTIYGIGSRKLGVQLGVSMQQAATYKKQYFKGLKGSREFFEKVVRVVSSRGWIKNRYGRLYVVPKELAYKGVNYLVQGTSADILSERMIEVDKYLSDKKSNILVQVHDEIICEVHNDELEEVTPHVQTLLQENTLGIPLEVDVEVCSPSWATKQDFALTETPEPVTISDYIDWN